MLFILKNLLRWKVFDSCLACILFGQKNSNLAGLYNSHVDLQKSMYPLQVIAQCGLWNRAIIGQYFLENADFATTAIVNGDICRSIDNRLVLYSLFLASM